MIKKYQPLKFFFSSSLSIALLSVTLCPPLLSAEAGSTHAAEMPHVSATPILSHLFWPIVNFTITVLILTFIFKKFVAKNLVSYRDHVASEIAHTKTLLENAQSLLQTSTHRLEGVQAEASSLVEEQTLTGQKVAEALIASAKISAEQIKRDTERQIEEELKRAEQQVRAGIIAEAIKNAEHLLKAQMTPELDREFREQALNRLGR